MSVEIVGIIDIGVGLAEITEAGPQLDILRNHVTWVKLDEHSWNFSYNVASSIDTADISISEGNRSFILLVCRTLISEEEMNVKSLYRMGNHVSSPADSLYIVSKWCGHNLASVLKIKRRVVVGL